MPHRQAQYLTSMPVNTGDRAPVGPRTVICFGVPRGGTSMVAGAILGLGVPMGEVLSNNIEDPEFNIVNHGGTVSDFAHHARATIAKRDAAHAIWGFKCPFAAQYLEEIIDDLRAPMLVYAYRDPVPMALRARVPAAERLEFVSKRLNAQTGHTALIGALGCPGLLVSYETATRHPSVFIEELAAFLGVEVPAHRDEIVEFIAPGSYKDPSALIARLTASEASRG